MNWPMDALTPISANPKLDLVLTRTTTLAPESIWAAWTTPALLEQWFCPRPYRAIDWYLDLRPGGAFSSTIVSPEGDRFPGNGCILEVVPNRRLVWTSALGPGYRPNPSSPEIAADVSFAFTGVIEIQPIESGTRYTATAIHADESSKLTHDTMGFEAGWGAAFDQLVELMS